MALLAALLVSGLTLATGTVRAANDSPGAVYSLTNAAAPAGNAVIIYNRAANGTLTSAGPNVPTGGLGTGSGLGSQGAVILSDDGSWLFAVNAGSNSISSFAVLPQGLRLVGQVSSGGAEPISLTFRNGLLYVLNAGSLSIAGFRVSPAGTLTPISGSVRPLNPSANTPEEIAFNPAGTVLTVTEKGSGQIDTYTVASNGSASGPITFATGAVGPYALAFDQAGQAIVSDAAIGAASSYAVGSNGALTAISSNVPDFHAAPCWIVVTNNGKYAYTANAHDGTISSFRIAPDGSLSLLHALAAGPVAVPLLDLALSGNSHFLYGADNGRSVAYQIASDGSLTPLASGAGLPVGVGLAAR
jgi:6-phosphogluconolactonase (cycloisomerase 2 family)